MEDRYEPLPALPQLPGWLWRKLTLTAKLTLAVMAVAAVATVVVLAALAPAQHRREDARGAAARAANLQAVRDDQRPRTAALAPGASAGEVVAALNARITSDMRSRAKGVRSTECRRLAPRRPDGSLLSIAAGKRYFKCFTLASSSASPYGTITAGYYVYASADVRRHRLAWCKLDPRPKDGDAPRVALGPPCVPEGW